MRTSIAIATFNGGKYLEAQLSSILAQTVLPDEVVISDDGSHDKTSEIVTNFKNKAPFFVHVLTNVGLHGYTRNIENALRNCTGDIIFICDQDDVWHPEKLELITMQFIKRKNVWLMIHDIAYCDSHLQRTGQTKLGRLRRGLISPQSYVTGMATALRRDFLSVALPIPDGWSYDSWLHSLAHMTGRRRVIGRVLAEYRRHDSNATASVINAPHSVTAGELIRSRKQKDRRATVRRHLFKIDDLAKWNNLHLVSMTRRVLVSLDLLIKRFKLRLWLRTENSSLIVRLLTCVVFVLASLAERPIDIRQNLKYCAALLLKG